MTKPSLSRVCALLLGVLLSITMLSPEARAADSPTSGTVKILEGLQPGTYALFETNHGDFVARLFTDKAPRTTANFIGLASGAKAFINPMTNKEEKRPYFDGLIFHRVIKGFMLQGGDPTGTGRGGPGFTIKDEFHPDLRHNKPGMLSMANAGPNTGGSQFFVTVAPTDWLDNKHAIFGEVVRGLDNVMKISELPTGAQDRPKQDVVMKHVTIHVIGDAATKSADAATTAAH